MADETNSLSRPVGSLPGVRGFSSELERAAFDFASKSHVSAADISSITRAITEDAAAIGRAMDAVVARARKSAA